MGDNRLEPQIQQQQRLSRINNQLFSSGWGGVTQLSNLAKKATESKSAISSIDGEQWNKLDEIGRLRAIQQIKYKSDILENVDKKLQKYVNISETLRSEIQNLETESLRNNLIMFMDAFDKVTNRGKERFEKNMQFSTLINQQRQLAIQKRLAERKAINEAKMNNSLFLALRD